MTRVVLIRHGATAVMEHGLTSRTPGIPLSARGLRQARALAQRLGVLHRVITSPIQRAVETAGVLNSKANATPEQMDSFTEFDFGDWTGKPFSELECDPEWKKFNEFRDLVRAPRGESMEDVQKRALGGLRQVLRETAGGAVAIVSHAEVIRAIILAITGTSLRNFWRFQIDPASITELVCGPEGDERIVRLNDCAHLEHLY